MALFGGTGTNLFITIPDMTRPLDVVPPLKHIRTCLEGDPTIMIGLGLHRPMTKMELQSLNGFRIEQHDPDDVVYTNQNYSWKHGEILGYINKNILEHEHGITIGIAELHQYAGYSGGYKGVTIGCGGRQTISALHHRDFVLQDEIVVGKISQNPFREAVDLLGASTPCRHALTWVPSLQQWIFGDPKQTMLYIEQTDNPWNFVQQPYKNIICNIPSAKSKSFYQASRIATYIAFSPKPPIEPQATFFIEAPLEEGLGTEMGFCRALESCPYPYTELLTGQPPTGAGAQRAVMIAKLAQQYNIEICGCINPHIFRDVGLSATSKPAPRNQPKTLVLDLQKTLSHIPQLQRQ